MAKVEIGVRTIDDMREEIKEEINKKFSYCHRLIRLARWRGYFNSNRGKYKRFGRWDKR